MTYRPKGKHVRINEDNPDALGICDYTGFVFNRIDLVRQMEWRGNALVWTGFYVGRPYLDVPNEQNRPPILPPDPVPIREPRIMQFQEMTWSNNTLQNWNNIPWPWASLWSLEDGSEALPYADALSSLQNYNWGL
jgi:hypothetical protein